MQDNQDFQAKARSKAASVLSSSLSPAEALAKSLTSDRPTIDSALKSYMSLCIARSMSATDPNNGNNLTTYGSIANYSKKCFFQKGNPQKDALLCARSLLKAMNSFTVPERNTSETSPGLDANEKKELENEAEEEEEEEMLEYDVVRIVWNGLIKNGKKPSLIMGRASLLHVYPLLTEACFQNCDDGDDSSVNLYPNDVDIEEAQAFVHEFGNLLISAGRRKNLSLSSNTCSMSDQDDDSCLIWDADGGKTELERRRKRREYKSSCILQDENKESSSCTCSAQTNGVTIEEIE